MLRYSIGPLSAEASAGLSAQQALVDKENDLESKYKTATKLFKGKSPKAAFSEVRAQLANHSPSGSACYYCERDRYRDIEHIWPKRHYPERCFDWNNYVFACTICNQDAKRDKFAVFAADESIIAFDRSLSFVKGTPIGDPVQLDIRTEDPFDFLQMDLQTGRFVAIGLSSRDQKRGIYTRDLFNLDNDVLSRIRRQAVNHFTDYITRYVQAKSEGRNQDAARLLVEIQELPFPTVLVEMRRQASNNNSLKYLFEELPQHVGARL